MTGHRRPTPQTLLLSLLLPVAFLLLPGCQGAQTRVGFLEARYPISMTAVVPGSDWRLLDEASLKKVGTFSADGRAWSEVWTLVTLSDVDFSRQVNKQVEDLGGDAVVNLKVKVGTPILPDVLPGFLFLHWLPIWPGSIYVRVEGDVVRAKKGKEARLTRAHPDATLSRR